MSFRRYAAISSILTICVFAIYVLSAVAWQDQATQPQHKPWGTGSQKNAPSQLESAAINLVSQKYNRIRENLLVYGSSIMNLSVTQVRAYHYTIAEKDYSWIKEITIDENGDEVDSEQLFANEQALYEAKFGKLDAELAKRLETASTGESLSVMISIKPILDDTSKPEEPDTESQDWARLRLEEKKAAIDKYKHENSSYQMERAKQAVAPVITRLENMGYKGEAINGSPFIVTTLPVKVIREIATWEEVVRISLDRKQQSALYTSRVTIGANVVEGLVNGGSGIRVTVVEPGGRVQRINGINPYLQGIVQDF